MPAFGGITDGLFAGKSYNSVLLFPKFDVIIIMILYNSSNPYAVHPNFL